MRKSCLIAAAAMVALMAAGTARAEVAWSVGIGGPRVGAVITGGPVYAPAATYYAPAPAYYAPAPVVYAPRYSYAPAPAYYAPAPVAYYPRPAYWRPVPVIHPHYGHYRPWVRASTLPIYRR